MGKFMVAQAYQDTWYEYEVNGETFVTDDDTSIPEDGVIIETYDEKWFSRLSAPGYMDCTDWQGPYNTEDGALWELYQTHGNDDETFFSFLEENHKIVAGSLRLTGLRNELYGTAVGESEIHLATMGDLEVDPETLEELPYDPNDDPDLGEAYGFEIVSLAKKSNTIDNPDLALLQRIINAKRDSEFWLNVHVFWLWSDNTWAKRIVSVPQELSEEDRATRAIGFVRPLIDDYKDGVM